MTDDNSPKTIQKTEWTNSLIEDLLGALRDNRDDATVRGFAKELIDEKELPIAYLVKKVGDLVGQKESERLNVLLRGRVAVDKEKVQMTKSKDGFLRGLMRKFRN